MKLKKQIKMLLKDPRHWFGWALTTGALILVFSQLPTEFMQSYIKIAIATFGTIVVVDIFKHLVKLQ